MHNYVGIFDGEVQSRWLRSVEMGTNDAGFLPPPHQLMDF